MSKTRAFIHPTLELGHGLYSQLIGFIQVALFSALRVSALYDRNIALFAAVLMLGLMPVGTNIFSMVGTIYIQEPGVCLLDSSDSDALAQKLTLLSRIPVIVADFLVLTLTWVKTYKQILLSRGIGISTSLSTCLARDGALYFLVLLTINILQIATYRTHLGGPLSTIVAVLPAILINRFMLNLRQVGSGSNASDTVDLEPFVIATPQFQLSGQVVGSMGEPLDHGGSFVPDDGENELYGENVEVLVNGHSSHRQERRGSQG